MRRGTTFFVLLTSSVVAGCGDNDDSGSGGPVALESLPAALAATYCRTLENCLGSYLALVPQPNCAANLHKQFENRTFAAIDEAVQARAVRYDAVKAGACLEAIENVGCDLFTNRNPVICDEALAGDVPLGGACSIGAECRGEAFCDLSANTCPGVCAERRADGGACDHNEDCESGLTCQASVCRAPAGPGQSCAGPMGAECRTGLTCFGQTTTMAGTCGDIAILTSGKAGEECSPAAEPRKLCEPSLSCVLESSTLTGMMTFACKAKSVSGAACRLGFPEPCPTGEYCKLEGVLTGDGVCARLPQNGEACLSDAFRLARCGQDLVCVDQTCAVRKANGADCATGAECYSELCLNGKCAGDAFCTE